MIPGPLGSQPAPGNPPTASNPQPTSQDSFNSLFNSQLGPIGTGAGIQYAGLAGQQASGQANQQITDQQLLQQFQDTLAGLGIQGTGIGQERQYEQGQYGLQQQGFGLQGQGLQEALANLQANYGYQQQQFGLQGQEIGTQYAQGLKNLQEGSAGSGTSGTGTYQQGAGNLGTQRQQELAQLGIQEGEAGQAYKYGLQQNQLAQGQLGLQEKQSGLTNTYQQQQIQNALAQLGLSQTQAGQQYNTGTQQAANQYADLLSQLQQQQGGIFSNEVGQASQLMNQLIGAGSYTGGL